MPHGLIKTREEIEIIAEGGKLIHDILHNTAKLAKPGLSTWELNEFAEKEINKIGGRPSFKFYGTKKNPFPSGLCTSINNIVVHGIPSKTDILHEGDIVSLDIGMEYKKLYTDTAITVSIGNVSRQAKELMDITKKSLDFGIKEARAGNRVGDISAAIQETVEQAGFNVVRDLVGHGVGYDVHEEPSVPCYGKKHDGPKLEEGMVLAIEPMVVMGEYSLLFEADGWTISTADGELAAHFEHTIAITKKGARILT